MNYPARVLRGTADDVLFLVRYPFSLWSSDREGAFVKNWLTSHLTILPPLFFVLLFAGMQLADSGTISYYWKLLTDNFFVGILAFVLLMMSGLATLYCAVSGSMPADRAPLAARVLGVWVVVVLLSVIFEIAVVVGLNISINIMSAPSGTKGFSIGWFPLVKINAWLVHSISGFLIVVWNSLRDILQTGGFGAFERKMIDFQTGWRTLVPEYAMPLVRVVNGLTCALIIILGLRWQARTFRGDRETGHRRVRWAAGVWLLCLVGAAVWGIFAYIDLQTSVPSATRYLLGILFIGAAFMLKTWLGPILVGGTVSWTAYVFLEHGRVLLLPLFELVLAMFLPFAPEYVGVIYVIATLAVAAVGGVYSSLHVNN